MKDLRVVVEVDTVKGTANLRQLDQALDQVERKAGGPVNASIRQLEQTTQKLGESSSVAGGVFRGALSANILFAAANGMMRFASETIEAADAIERVADRTGIAAEAVQELEYVAKQSSNTIDQVTTAISQMQNRLGEGNKGAVGAVKALGLNLEDLLKLTPDKQFEEIAKAIAKVEDPTRRTQLAMDLFGRSGAAILPTLIADMEKLRAEAPKMSNEAVAALNAVGDALMRLGASAKTGVVNAIGGVLASLNDIRVKSGAVTLSEVAAANETALKKLQGSIPKTTTSYVDLAGKGFRPAALEGKALDDVLAHLTRQNALSVKATKATEEAMRDAAKAAREWRDGIASASEQMYWLTSSGSGFDELAPLVEAAGTELLAATRAEEAWTAEVAAATRSNAGFVTGLAPAIKGMKDVGREADAAAKSMGDRFANIIRGLPNLLQQAFTGGGGIIGALKSLGVQIADAITADFQESLAKNISTAATNAYKAGGIASVGKLALPYLGPAAALIGIAAGWQNMRKEDALHRAWSQANREALAATEARYSDDVKVVVPQYQKMWGQSAALSGVTPTQAFPNGGGWDITTIKAQIPLLEELTAKELDLVDAQRQLVELQGQLIPKWDDVQALVEKYGLSVDSAGQKVQQLKVTADATSLVNDWQTLERAGWDVDSALGGMKEEFRAVALESKKYGVEMPAQMRPVLEAMVKQGLLTDENGRKLEDLSGFKFGAPVVTEADKIKEAMGLVKETILELKDAIRDLVDKIKALVTPSEETAGKIREHWRRAPWSDWEMPTFPERGGGGPDTGDRGRGHTGAYVGQGGLLRFHAGGLAERLAPRFHLGIDEVPAILQAGEGILSRDVGMSALGGRSVLRGLNSGRLRLAPASLGDSGGGGSSDAMVAELRALRAALMHVAERPVYLDGKKVSRNQVRHIPGELTRAGR
jgi:hypothetical protein